MKRSLQAANHYPLLFAALAGGSILVIAAIAHIRSDPFPSWWDEAGYVNGVCADRFDFLRHGLAQYFKDLVWISKDLPPGYRMAALPSFAFAAPTPALLRSLTLASLIVSAVLLFCAGREIAGIAAGIVCACIFSFSAAVFVADMTFGTEITLYPAIAGCLYGLARWFGKGHADILAVIVLGISAGAGALSKTSFLAVFLPLIATALLVAARNGQSWRSLLLILAGAVCGLATAAPWWLSNWYSAYLYAKYASAFVRSNFPWLPEAAIHLLGVPFTIAFVMVLVWALTRGWKFWAQRDRTSLGFALVCAAGFIPLTLLHVAGTNHNMRLVTPALLPFGGAVAVLLESGGLLGQKAFSLCAAPLLVAQAGFAAWLGLHNGWDAWDWNQLRLLARADGLPAPSIVHLGNGNGFDPPQIEYPWACRGEAVSETWLWRFEDGPIDWRVVDKKIDRADIVITAPGYEGDISDMQNLDNQHNDELSRRLSEKPDIWQKVTPAIDRDHHATVLVFLRRSRIHP